MTRLLLALLLALLLPARGWAQEDMGWISKSTPACADGAVSARCKCGGAKVTTGYCTSNVWAPTQFYVAFAGAACQTTVAGTGISVTDNRNSIAWVTKGGTESQCAANQSRIGDLGVLGELQATQYLVNPDAPATQTLSMGTGGYYATAEGSGSVGIAVSGATASGLPCTMTAASPCSFTVSGAGNVVYTVTGSVTFFNVTNWAKSSSKIHSAMTRLTENPQFTTPAISNDYCVSVPGGISPWNGNWANLSGLTPVVFVGLGNSRTAITISQIGSIVATYVDSTGGSKTLTVTLSAAEMLTSHTLSACRSAAGAVSLYLDGVSVGIAAGAGTGIASTTPATPTYVGTSTSSQGPIWIADVGMNADSTKPGVTLETRTRIDGLGDSITAGFGAGTSYPTTLSGLLGGGYLVTNSGVSGQATTAILSRYQTGQIQDRRYKVLIVLAGINDIRTDIAVATIESNLQAIYDAHRAQGGQLMIATMLPWAGYADYTAGRETNRQTVNTWIKAYGTTNSIPVVDFSTTFDNGSGAIKAEWNNDNLHPNEAGYIEIGNEFYAAGHTAGYW